MQLITKQRFEVPDMLGQHFIFGFWNAPRLDRSGHGCRLGCWLLLGWLAFWLPIVGHACQLNNAAPGQRDGLPTVAPAASACANAIDSHTRLPAPDTDCYVLMAAAIGASVTSVSTNNAFDLPLVAAPAASAHAPRLEVRAVRMATPTGQRQPTPLYLRNQRLLI